jgi:hypothetical protein
MLRQQRADRSRLAEDWVRQWHRILLDATAHAHADAAGLAAQMRAAFPSWSTGPRISLVIERPPPGLGDSIAAWSPLPVMAGPPKHHLSIFLSVATGQPVTGRIEWMDGAFHQRHAQALSTALRTGLDILAENALAQPAGEVPAARVPTAPSQWASTATARTEPSTDLDGVIAGMASTILGKEVNSTTDFFVAGAQSLELVRLCTAIRTRLGHQVEVVDVFDHPTPQRLAAFVRTRTAAPSGRDLP